MKHGWQAEPLGQLCEVLDHRRKPVTKRDRVAGPYPYYGATGIQDYVAEYLFNEPLVLVGEDGAKWGSGENTAFAIEGKCWVNNHAHVLRPRRDTVLDNWLIYYLNHSDLSGIVSGLTVPKLNQGTLREIPVPVPPLLEQQWIVGILDEAFDSIATAKANAERNFNNARALFESHLQSVFTQRGAGWTEMPLAGLCDSKRVITYGVIKLGDEVLAGIPCLRTSNVQWLRIDTDGIKRIAPSLSAEYARTVLEGGEVLVNVRGTLGGVSVATPQMAGWNVSREVAVIPVNPSKINPNYLAYWIGAGISQHWLGGVKKGAAYVGINIEDLRMLPVCAPKMEQQLDVVRSLDAFQAKIKNLVSLYRRKLAGFEALKRALLRQAFAGEL